MGTMLGRGVLSGALAFSLALSSFWAVSVAHAVGSAEPIVVESAELGFYASVEQQDGSIEEVLVEPTDGAEGEGALAPRIERAGGQVRLALLLRGGEETYVVDPAEQREVEGILWESSDEAIATVEGGVVEAVGEADGEAIIRCTVTACDRFEIAEGEEVSCEVVVDVSGQTDAKAWESEPRGELKVRLAYEDDLSVDVSSKLYSAETLASASASRALVQVPYTQPLASGGWRTVSGEGVYVDDLLADLGVEDISQVAGLFCLTTDNEFFLVGAEELFDAAGHYFPRYDVLTDAGARSTTEGKRVFPMIAVRSHWAEGSCEVDFEGADDRAGFELLRGVEDGAQTDSDAPYGIARIYYMDVILRGAPEPSLGGILDQEQVERMEQQGASIGAQVSGALTATGELDGPATLDAAASEKAESASATGAGATASPSAAGAGVTASPSAAGASGILSIPGAAGVTAASEGSTLAALLEEREAAAAEAPLASAEARSQVKLLVNEAQPASLPERPSSPSEPFALPVALAVAAMSGARTVVNARKEEGKGVAPVRGRHVRTTEKGA